MIEQQIEEEIVLAHSQGELASNEREAGSQFQQKLLDVLDQAIFKIPFDGIVVQREEIEQVRIFKALPGEIGLLRR